MEPSSFGIPPDSRPFLELLMDNDTIWRTTLMGRDPEDRRIDEGNLANRREKMLDKTVADSFPASDPPSTNPAPEHDSFEPE